MSVIPNVLAERYASAAMKSIWSAEGRIILEREFWIAVMKAQRDLGLDIPDGVIEAYERVKDQVNLPSIDARERVTRHDVKARIEEFCELARMRAYPQGHDLPGPDGKCGTASRFGSPCKSSGTRPWPC